MSNKSYYLDNVSGNNTDHRPDDHDAIYDEPYAEYEAYYDPEVAEAERRQIKKPRNPRSRTDRAQSAADTIVGLTEATEGLEAGFKTTYQPARFETEWLLGSLRPFYDLGMISDVMAIVKGGKEANVYRCLGGPAAGAAFVAAKVYRPRQFRNLRNDRIYREGRAVLNADGKPVKGNEHRIMRALNKKTDFGVQVAHTSWLMHEYTTLQKLHRAGAAVPRPIHAAENAILMDYRGDDHRAAPTLHEVKLAPPLARRLRDEVLHNIEIMLQADLIHGDLSAYNILFWEDEITLIDFPQVTNAAGNSHARELLNRDVERVCDYFALHGVPANARALADHLWNRYQALSENDQLADLSRTLADLEDEDDS